MRPWSFVVGLLTVVTPAMPASANQVLLKNRAVTCVATAPNIVRMWVDGTGFMLAPASRIGSRPHSSAASRQFLRRLCRQRPGRPHQQGPRAEQRQPLNRLCGIECTIFHRNITSVHDCRGTADRRTCEVGLAFSGGQHAYLVSVSIKPVSHP